MLPMPTALVYPASLAAISGGSGLFIPFLLSPPETAFCSAVMLRREHNFSDRVGKEVEAVESDTATLGLYRVFPL